MPLETRRHSLFPVVLRLHSRGVTVTQTTATPRSPSPCSDDRKSVVLLRGVGVVLGEKPWPPAAKFIQLVQAEAAIVGTCIPQPSDTTSY
jgi:hypothetical protein